MSGIALKSLKSIARPLKSNAWGWMTALISLQIMKGGNNIMQITSLPKFLLACMVFGWFYNLVTQTLYIV